MAGIGERWTRNPDGSIEKISADMSFEEWQGKFVAQESDLGDSLRRIGKSIAARGKVVGFNGLPKDLQEAFREGLSTAAPETRKILRREYRKADYIVSSGKKSYYRPMESVVEIGRNATPSTLAHELFHKIDAGGKISMGLSEALARDYVALNVASETNIRNYLMRLYPEAFTRISKAGMPVMGEAYRGVADILNGLSGGKETYGFKHSIGYWASSGALEAETWAQFGRIQYENDLEVLKLFQDIFPNFSQDAIIALKGLV